MYFYLQFTTQMNERALKPTAAYFSYNIYICVCVCIYIYYIYYIYIFVPTVESVPCESGAFAITAFASPRFTRASGYSLYITRSGCSRKSTSMMLMPTS